MTQEEFEIWIGETVPCALFHLMDTDKDDVHGVKLDELILVELIAKNPGVLKYKSLDWLVNHFINTYTLEKHQAQFNIKNRFSIDFFEFSFLVEACIPPVPIARHSFWEDVINKYYYVLTQEERNNLFKYIIENFRFDKYNKDCLLFAARFDPKNQYNVKFKEEVKEVKECFLWEGNYHTAINKYIIPEKIIEVKPIII